MRVTMLGCGSSAGVPLIGCDCPVCTSDNPKNRRTRVSVFIEINGISLLVDSSPDLRQQAIANGIKRIDAVLYTHDHADHTHGLDDLRSFNHLSGESLPVYASSETLEKIRARFGYAFQPKPEHVWFRPSLIPHILPDIPVHKFAVSGIDVTCFAQQHGKMKTLGYRIGNFAYSTDIDVLPETAFKTLEGVEIWFVDCLRYVESYSHSNLENTLAWIARVKPELAVLTHMAHDFDYARLAKELPLGVVPGYDGMVVELS